MRGSSTESSFEFLASFGVFSLHRYYDKLESAVLEFFTKEDWQAVVGDGECEPLRIARALVIPSHSR
jgi:hypothetical protein